MTNFYNADIVSVDNNLFESVNCALEYITQNYRDWCSITYMETELRSVEWEDGSIVVKYTITDDGYEFDSPDDAEREEYFEVTYKDMMTTVLNYTSIFAK